MKIRTPTREDVISAFRLFLNRDPESEETITLHLGASDKLALIRRLMESEEFNNIRQQHSIESFNHTLPGNEPKYVLTETTPTRKYWVNLRDKHVSQGILDGCWEPRETRFVESYLRSGMKTIDIGANLGWFTVIMADMVGPEGHVTAFEPRNDIYSSLCRTVRANGFNNVTLHNLALGAEEGVLSLVWTRSDENPGGTRLETPSHVESPDDLRQETPVRRLDDVVSGPVDFIKIDVEGAEQLVFEGGRKWLQQHKPIILSELHPGLLSEVSRISIGDYFGFLAGLGYECHELGGSGELGATISAWNYPESCELISVILKPVS